MKGMAWLNLSSTNLPRAKKFFMDLGFEINELYESPQMVSMFVGENKLVVNLFDAKVLQEAMGGQTISDGKKCNEVLVSLGANSPAEIDQMAKNVVKAGGVIYAGPALKDGWMYGFGFIDPDGHRWNGLYMDLSKLPQ